KRWRYFLYHSPFRPVAQSPRRNVAPSPSVSMRVFCAKLRFPSTVAITSTTQALACSQAFIVGGKCEDQKASFQFGHLSRGCLVNRLVRPCGHGQTQRRQHTERQGRFLHPAQIHHRGLHRRGEFTARGSSRRG